MEISSIPKLSHEKCLSCWTDKFAHKNLQKGLYFLTRLCPKVMEKISLANLIFSTKIVEKLEMLVSVLF